MTLPELIALAEDVARNGSECDSTAELLARTVAELLDTPAECAWPKPVVDRGLHDEHGHAAVTWESLGPTVMLGADESIALGVQLMAAGLEAKKR